MKTLVVVNPHSANGATGKNWHAIRRALQDALGSFEEQFTSHQCHATRLVREGLAKGIERVIAVGGDGTNNEVVNGFFENERPIRPGAVLGFVPRGTGGDLRKTLHIDLRLEHCIPVLAAGKHAPADVGVATFNDHQGNQVRRHFINITSFGIGGMVDKKVNQSSKALGGKMSFLLGTMKALFAYRNQLVRLLVKDGSGASVFEEEMLINNVAVANGQYFGGGMWVAPEARIDDGLFDVVVLGDLRWTEVVFKASRIYKGTHLHMPKVRFVRGSRVEAWSDSEVLIDMDGEQPGRLPITLDILPGAIQLIVP